jgi:hypothetical protein
MRVLTAVGCLALITTAAQFTSQAGSRLPSVEITQRSIRINGAEIRSATNGYIIPGVVVRLLGKPQAVYLGGLGVRVHAWRDVGIHIQREWRGAEKGKLFKFQVWLVDNYDKDENQHSGRFSGRITVEEVEIVPDSTLDSLRPRLETAGFHITEHPGVIEAEKGQVSIFTVGTTNKLQRVEAWCTP